MWSWVMKSLSVWLLDPCFFCISSSVTKQIQGILFNTYLDLSAVFDLHLINKSLFTWLLWFQLSWHSFNLSDHLSVSFFWIHLLCPSPEHCWCSVLFSSSFPFHRLFLDNIAYSNNFLKTIYKNAGDSHVHIFPSWTFSWAWMQLPSGHLNTNFQQQLKLNLSKTELLAPISKSASPMFPIPVNSTTGHWVDPARKKQALSFFSTLYKFIH